MINGIVWIRFVNKLTNESTANASTTNINNTHTNNLISNAIADAIITGNQNMKANANIIDIINAKNIDDDHMNYYQTRRNLERNFLKFINKVPFYGFCVLNADDESILNL